MGYLLNSGNQKGAAYLYRADGVIASSSAPQLLLPQSASRATLMIQNLSNAAMYVEVGPARAHAVLTSGVVTSVVIDNAGFNYTRAPVVRVYGGAAPVPGTAVVPPSWPGSHGQIPEWPVPQGPGAHPARIRAVLTGGAISSFIIDDGGAGYVNPPEIFLDNDPSDPFGCADPSANTGNGFYLPAIGGLIQIDSTGCPNSAVAIFCATLSSKFTVAYML